MSPYDEILEQFVRMIVEVFLVCMATHEVVCVCVCVYVCVRVRMTCLRVESRPLYRYMIYIRIDIYI